MLANEVVHSYLQVYSNKPPFLVPLECNFTAFAVPLGCTIDTTFWYQIPGAESKIFDDEQAFTKLVVFGKQQHLLGAASTSENIWKYLSYFRSHIIFQSSLILV